MCWSAEVSLQSFMIGSLAIGIGALYGVKAPILLFAATITAMQLIEYIVWTYYKNQTVNNWASQAGSFVLFLQPIAAILTLKPSPFRTQLLTLFISLGIVGRLFLYDSSEYSMSRAEDGHLAWNWLKKEPKTYLTLAVYMFFLFYPLLLSRSYEILGVGILTLGVSLHSFWNNNTWGSMWCWIVNLLVPVLIGSAMIR